PPAPARSTRSLHDALPISSPSTAHQPAAPHSTPDDGNSARASVSAPPTRRIRDLGHGPSGSADRRRVARPCPGALLGSRRCVQNDLTYPDRLRGHLHAFVGGAELQRLLQTQLARAVQPLQLLTGRRADVGELLLLGDVDVHVLG